MILRKLDRKLVVIQTFPEHLGTKTEEHTSEKHGEVEEYLNSTVFGQDVAVRKVTDSITVPLAGLKDPNKPIASYPFTGPNRCR